MILISKEEAVMVRKKYPNASIVRTCRQKSNRHKYYMPEKFVYLKIIRKTNRDAADILKERKGKKYFEMF